jgi:hypothetical protein
VAELDAFSRLQLEHERTQFVFYGHRMRDGRQGGPYFKLAESLSEALADLWANPAVADEGLYFVNDAFVVREGMTFPSMSRSSRCSRLRRSPMTPESFRQWVGSNTA